MEVVNSHCAGLDVHKKSVVACRITPHETEVFWLHHTSVRNQAKKSWQFDHSHTVKLAGLHIML